MRKERNTSEEPLVFDDYFFLLFFAASPAYGVGFETEPSFIERSVKRKVLFLDIITKSSPVRMLQSLCSD